LPITNPGVGLDRRGATRNGIAIRPQPLRGEWLTDFDVDRGLWLEEEEKTCLLRIYMCI
jgi:hypothetical protein